MIVLMISQVIWMAFQLAVVGAGNIRSESSTVRTVVVDF